MLLVTFCLWFVVEIATLLFYVSICFSPKFQKRYIKIFNLAHGNGSSAESKIKNRFVINKAALDK